MDAERERRLADLLLAAVDRPAIEQRAVLEQACGDDRELLDEALACLAEQAELGDFLEQPAGPAVIGWQEDGPPDLRSDSPPSPTGPSGVDARSKPYHNTKSCREATAVDSDRLVDSDRPVDSDLLLGATAAGGASHRPSSAPRGGPALAAAGPSDLTEPFTDSGEWREKLGKIRLGAYRIVGLVGEGGMGQVYVGEDRRLGRQVAVKILPAEMAERADWLERFDREARALAALNHPNIVTIHSIEQDDDGSRFLTMELVAGKTLKERIAEEYPAALPVAEILRIAIDLTGALAAAQRRGIVHRDLKPANVMITDDGRVKILDFGIAKLSSLGPSKASLEGMVIGTVAYMAPEQISSEPVDARTDLFSLGVMLFEAATGEHPFPAKQAFRRMDAILHNEPADALELRPDLPPELGAVIGRCLEKVPARRYPDADTLHRDLAELAQARLTRKILKTHTRVRWAVPVLVAALLVAMALTVTVVRRAARPAPLGPTTAVAEAAAPGTSLAVFSFHNLTGDPELAWLSDGIAELLVTDLAQSPGLVVFGRAEVHRLLAEVDAEPAGGELAAAVVRAVAERGDLKVVVRGSYARMGKVLRIAYLLEDPLTGRVLRSASFEGAGDESLFGLVDQLGATVLESVGATRPEISPTVEQATTSSVLAWQAYVDAQNLYLEESRTEDAIARLETALEIDPDFALAAVAASKMHQSQGRGAEARAYSRQAFERVDHLPLRMRFKVEGDYYGNRWATLGRAIETYVLALKIYPGYLGWHNNLARRYAFFERYAEAREEFGRAIETSAGFWGNVYGAANVDAALGDYETGGALLQKALAADPEHWLLQYATAWHLTEWGRLDEAAAIFDQLARRRPGSVRIPYGRWRLALLRDNWSAADREARRLLEIDDPFARWRGNVALARNALYRGRAREALAHFDAAIAAATGADRALARCFKAELQLTLGEPAAALAQARLALTEGLDQWPELKGFFLAALAQQALGRPAAADRLLTTLQDRWRRQPNVVEERQLLHLTGLLALARGDAEAGRGALERAVALLPARGVEFSWHVFPDHVPLWVDLGEAELAAGRPAAAARWLGRASTVGSERIEQPVPYVRGLYLEGLARQAAGSPDEAPPRFKRFLSYWAGGELHRDWLIEARPD